MKRPLQLLACVAAFGAIAIVAPLHAGAQERPIAEAASPSDTAENRSVFDGCSGVASDARSRVPRWFTDERLLGSSAPLASSPDTEPILRVDVEATDSSIRFAQIDDGTRSQLIGYVGELDTNRISASFSHRVACPGARDARIHIDVLPSGQALIHVVAPNEDEAHLLVDPPWAVDERGNELPTWFEAEGSTLRQVVEITGSQGAIAFDPTYTPLLCGRYQNDRSAQNYLNMSSNDGNPFCPGRGIFIASQGYIPQWGDEQYLRPQHGKVAIDPLGDKCSNSPDAVPGIYNFEVPCLAHDYCYDLIRAGFGGTVSKVTGCDWQFGILMNNYCNNRHSSPFSYFQRQSCLAARGVYQSVVSAWFAPGFEPGLVTLRNRMSNLCVGVEGTLSAGAFVQQEGCVYANDRRWRVAPDPNVAGRFQLRPVGNFGLCITVGATSLPVSQRVRSSSCSTFTSTRVMRIQGHDGLDRYSIRPNHYNGECLSVPNNNVGANLRSVACQAIARQRWDILPS